MDTLLETILANELCLCEEYGESETEENTKALMFICRNVQAKDWYKSSYPEET